MSGICQLLGRSFCLGLWLLLAGRVAVTFGQDESESKFFQERVVPILETRCFGCHSHAAGLMEGDLALDWRSGWEQGGGRGPAIVPEEVDKSLLIRVVRRDDPQLAMPPEEPLSEEERGVLEEWVRRGAYDPRQSAPQASDPLDWWSLRKLETGQMPERWGGMPMDDHPIDRWVFKRLNEAGLAPSAVASPRDRIRRLFNDLIGLPPSPEEVHRFEADPSPVAYERLVDRLLASPRYGERWARHWMDTIHFAESHGFEHDVGRDHAWPYRDYLIDAFNRDLPWGEFIRQQLAMDHDAPQATHLTPALGFLGAGTFDLSTYSTGPMTFASMDRDDMVTQTMSAFCSVTANCARCHAHKFDPVSQEDYYALQAVFAGVLKGDVEFDADSEIATRRSSLEAQRRLAVERDPQYVLAAEQWSRVQRWREKYAMQSQWHPVAMSSFVSAEGATLTKQADGFLLASGHNPEIDTYTLTFQTDRKQLTALRLEVAPQESLPMRGPGRCQNGNLHLSEVQVLAFSPGEATAHAQSISRATADFNQDGWTIDHAIDGNPKTAWGIHPSVGQPHAAVFELSKPVEVASGMVWTVLLRQLHGGSHTIGCLRLLVTDGPADQAMVLPSDIAKLLKQAESDLSQEDRLTLGSWVLQQEIEREISELPERQRVYAVGRSVKIPTGNGKEQDGRLDQPSPVHFLQRGEIGKPLHRVAPGAFEAIDWLPSRFAGGEDLPESARRAALAEWIAHRENPLTWRSIVNRIWHHHFGRGICDTPGDLGRMGGVPSHPELLDWLAIWFRDEAEGSLKKLHRLIVTSHTYQQASEDRSEAAMVDGENRLLWRQYRRRLDADAYRDWVMAISDSLDTTMGGPSIQQFRQSPGPQSTPKLDYDSFDWNSPAAFRRTIYRYVWRGIPDPFMASLDFPDLGLLAPTRGFSASPMQALALFNHRFMLVHSERMAESIAGEVPELRGQVTAATWRAFGREPTAVELEEMAGLVERRGLAALCRVLLNANELLFVP